MIRTHVGILSGIRRNTTFFFQPASALLSARRGVYPTRRSLWRPRCPPPGPTRSVVGRGSDNASDVNSKQSSPNLTATELPAQPRETSYSQRGRRHLRVVLLDLVVEIGTKGGFAEFLLLLEVQHNHLTCGGLLGDIPDIFQQVVLQGLVDCNTLLRTELYHLVQDVER